MHTLTGHHCDWSRRAVHASE